GTELRLLFGCWQNHLHGNGWRLPSQRQHLVHSDSGADRCIAQLCLANRFLHSGGAQLGNVSRHHCESLFPSAMPFASRSLMPMTVWLLTVAFGSASSLTIA